MIFIDYYMKISPSNSFKGFDIKTFLLGFKKPAIILISFVIGAISVYLEDTNIAKVQGVI